MIPLLYFLSSNWLPLFLPNQTFFCLIGRYAGCKPTYGSLIGNNIRDVRNWRVGEFPGPSPIIACASTRTIISRQLKTDAIPTEDGQLYQKKKKKKRRGRNVCVCVCVCVKYLGYGGAATTYWMMKKCSGADCYNVLLWLLFLQKLAERLHISN